MSSEAPQQPLLHREQAPTNGAMVAGPIGGPLPPADTPMKPHLPPPEVSAVREEQPAPATVHYLSGDDRATAAAAAAAAGSASSAVAAESQPIQTTAPISDTPPQPLAPPPHESEARELNGTGLASTLEGESIASKKEIVASTANDSQSTVAPTEGTGAPSQSTAPTSHVDSAPGTQNVFNQSEEKDLGVPPPSNAPEGKAAAPPVEHDVAAETPEAVPPHAQQAAEVKPVPAAEVPTTQSLPTNAEPPKPEADGDVEMKDEPAPAPVAAPATEANSSPAVSSSNFAHRRESTAVSADGSALPLAGPQSTSMSAAQIKACQNAVKGLKARTDSAPFHNPVDPVALGIPHYPTIVTQPMDLGTVDLKLALTAAAQKGGNKHTDKTRQAAKWSLDTSKDVYYSLEDFEKDVRLIFSNCIKFNGAEHPLSAVAQTLDGVFDKQLKSLAAAAVASDDNGSDAGVAHGGARRQSESVTAARPKREVHPPPPKDLPYADRPQAAGGLKRKKSRGSLTAREAAYIEKLDKEQLKFCLKAIEDFHKPPLNAFAWVFYEKPSMDLEFAPTYYATIKNPISFKEIKQRLLAGEYEDANGVKEDVNLLVNNCFTFNEKGSDVYVMGEQVKKAWSTKMADLPRPAPSVADDDYDEDEEDETFADDDDDIEAQMQAIRNQIASLQAKLERLKSKPKSVKKPSATKKRRPSEGGGSAAKKAPAQKKAKSSAAQGGEPKKAVQKAAKKSDGPAKKRTEEEDVREVTYEQKEELAAKISSLPDDRLDGALKIIAEDKPTNANEDEEFEFDIEDLSPGTLYRLYRYVVRPKGKKVTTSKLSSSDGRKRGTGGVKRKNLDESEEAARIARLQAQLDQFDSAPPNTSAAPNAVAAAGHDDLVASDSSSGEEDYESESDYE